MPDAYINTFSVHYICVFIPILFSHTFHSGEHKLTTYLLSKLTALLKINNCQVILMTCLTIPLSLGQQVYLLMEATLVYHLIYTLTYVLPSS